MKKEKLKEILLYLLIILIGVSCIYFICLRAEQLDRQQKVNNAIHKIIK